MPITYRQLRTRRIHHNKIGDCTDIDTDYYGQALVNMIKPGLLGSVTMTPLQTIVYFGVYALLTAFELALAKDHMTVLSAHLIGALSVFVLSFFLRRN